MPRIGRIAPGGVIQHVLNRGNGRQRLFHKPADYDAFLKLIVEVKQKVPVQVLGFCLMPNHWHLVLLPKHDGDLSKFMLRLTTAHVRRHFAHYRNEGGGHLYQGRFRNFPTQDDRHLLLLLRYVEANVLRARMVRDAKQWRWGSLRHRLDGDPLGLLDEWPIARPRNWDALVQDALPPREVQQIQTSIERGRPLGSDQWVKRTAARLGLSFTLRPRGRPRHEK